MKMYTYKFADGTRNTVEVSDGLFEFLTESDRQEKYGNRRETRRHVSLESLAEKCIEPLVTDEYDFSDLFQNIRNDDLYNAIQSLNKEQKELIHKVFFERKRLKEIAKDEKVSRAAISMRLSATLSQLRIKR